jgi:hypothetical protein
LKAQAIACLSACTGERIGLKKQIRQFIEGTFSYYNQLKYYLNQIETAMKIFSRQRIFD